MLAKAGKKVVVLEQGPDWKLTDLISSDFWGRRIKPAGGPSCSKARTPSATAIRRLGRRRCRTALLRQFPAAPSERLQDQERARPRAGLADLLFDVAPYYDKVAQDIGVSGDAKAEEIWRPAGEPYPMPPMKTFRNGEVWLKGFEAVGIRMVPAAVA